MEKNGSEITEFILLGFEAFHHLSIIQFLVFLLIYVMIVAANILTIFLIVTDQHLHTPMYFFLGNLSGLEILYSSTTLPRMLTGLLTGKQNISAQGCFTQLYFFSSLICTECYLLSVMSYDRFLAICRPLHYVTVMNGKHCVQLASCCWINSIVVISIYVSLVLQLHYCGSNEIDHFFCDSLALIKISCSDASLVKYACIIVAFGFSIPPFLLTLISYMYIITAILKIPSTTGRQKAFSTCSSHLIAVSVFYGPLIIVYLTPKSKTVKELPKLFSLLNTILPPLVNPLVYSLRNKDVKDALRKVPGKCLGPFPSK